MKDNKKKDSIIGLPQGSIISPILSNIYLHSFDCFMQDLINKSKESGLTHIPNKEYLSIHSKIHTIYRKMNKGLILTVEKKKELKSLITKRGQLKSSLNGKGYRIYYVRYADDFLIGINGNKAKVELLRKEINDFLTTNLKLELNLEKTKITHSHVRTLFLGFNVYRPTSRTRNQKTITKNIKGRQYKARIPATKTHLMMPIDKLINKLKNQGFCKVIDFNQGQIIPIAKTAWMPLPLDEIVNKYNSILLGLINYYNCANNFHRMQFLQFIIQHSCAKTIARKTNIRRRAQVFKKYGNTISIPINNKGKKTKTSLKLRKSFSKISKRFNINPHEPLDIVYHGLRSRTKLYDNCLICNSAEKVEMHHIKALKGKPIGISNTMKALNRKQIPLCRICHLRVHRGIYDGPNLSKILDDRSPNEN